MKKIMLGILTLILTLTLLGCDNDETKQTLSTWSDKEVNTDSVLEISKAILVKENIQTQVTDDQEGGKDIIIQYELGTQIDEKRTVKNVAYDSIELFEILFQNPNVTRVIIAAQTTFLDQYGKELKDNAVAFKMYKESASKIDWSNFKNMVSNDYNNLIKVCEQHYINPAIKAKLDN